MPVFSTMGLMALTNAIGSANSSSVGSKTGASGGRRNSSMIPRDANCRRLVGYFDSQGPGFLERCLLAF